jgi:DNA-binding MarR family transcriptional regulator
MEEQMALSTSEKSPLDRIADWYESSVMLRVGAVALAPVTSGATAILDAGIVSAFAFLRRARLNALKNNLIVLNLQPTEEEIHSREFIEAFVATASRTERTKREEKIMLFARLFRSYWRDGVFTPESYDKYEEDLAIIDELGYREFMVLSILEKYEGKYPPQPGMNRLQRARQFWSEFQGEVAEDLGIKPEEVEGYLQRLSRTGLYQPITGSFLDYSGGLGYLAPGFERLKARLNSADLPGQ